MSAQNLTPPVTIHPGVRDDLLTLQARAQSGDKVAERTLLIGLNTIAALKNGRAHATKPLELMRSYPDLSDCVENYIGSGPDSRPTHRLIWRDVPADPEQGTTARREILALAERDLGRVFHLAGSRLGRPVGYSMEELRTAEHARQSRSDRTAQVSYDEPSAQPDPSDNLQAG